MSYLSFEFMLVGQVLLDEAACSGAPQRWRPSPAQPHNRTSSRRQQSRDSLCFYNSFLAALQTNLGFIEKDDDTQATASPRTSAATACSTLYPIPEEEEGEEEDDDDDDADADDDADDDEERLYALESPLARLFTSCFVPFAYLMAMDRTPRSPAPMYKNPKSLL